MQNGTAKTPAKVIVAKGRNQIPGGRAGRDVDFVIGVNSVKYVVAQVFKRAAVEGFSSPARDHVDRRATVSSIFRGKIGGLDGDLVNKVNAHIGELAGIGALIQVKAPIYGKVVAIGTPP